MKIWELEREYDGLISFVKTGREGKKRDVRSVVAKIKEEIIARRDRAVIDFSKAWDHWDKDYPIKLSLDEIESAASRVPRKDVSVLKGMIKNVALYHKGQKPKKRTYRRGGLLVEEEHVSVEKAMVYVPGGSASYPSSLIMGTVPAQIAGVQKIFVSSPGRNGKINDHVAAAARLLGVADIYRIGGAQAIYAFAYGTESVPKVDMIVGPGNTYVEEAKRDVYGSVGIDMLAGPSELVILCTEAYSSKLMAIDMFSQAEHDEMASVGIFSPSLKHLNDVKQDMEGLLGTAARKETIRKAIEANGYLVHYTEIDRAVEAINEIAPEHMELIGDETCLPSILYPGVIYVGPYTPVAMGDYYIGTNHVLPTAGAGRFSAGLSVDRFTKRKVVVKINREFIRKYGDRAERLARVEGLPAHGDAIKARKELDK
ncbi:MAG: histidinol dehydrogenase [Syntrophorhabdaceae bacterium]|nr:histidinol dehydrogenase [Syntrophorhabdaceae bacterium]